MTLDRLTWLTQEVSDLLDVSSVGIYEFIWLLRGRYPDIGQTESREIAEHALNRLIIGGKGRLFQLEWPKQDLLGEFDRRDLTQADWYEPKQSKLYVAFGRN